MGEVFTARAGGDHIRDALQPAGGERACIGDHVPSMCVCVCALNCP